MSITWSRHDTLLVLVLAMLAAAVAVAAFLTEPEEPASHLSNPPHGATP